MPNWKVIDFSQSSDSQKRQSFKAGVLLWVIVTIVIGIVVVHNPFDSTVTNFYQDASFHWLARANLYSGGHLCMNYLPHFAILYTPFFVIYAPEGDILWRCLAIALLATGTWRLLKQIFGEAAARYYFWATLFTVPLAAAALRNGQSNALLGGLMLHSAASLSARKWWAASCFIMLAVIAKPVALVLVLLAPVVYRQLRLPVIVSLVTMAVFPYLFARPDYVTSQYHAFLSNLRECAVVTEYDYADITGILRPFHIELSPLVSQIMRVSAGLVTLALWWLGARRMQEPFRAFWLLTLAAGYLMLFNPMNESNSYVVLAPVLAIWSGFFLSRSRNGIGWTIAFMALSMGLFPNILRPIFGNKMSLFYHPLMTIILLVMLVICIWREKKPAFGMLAPALEEAPRTGSKEPLPA